MIDAATKLKKENAKFKIYIIGEGPEKKNLESQIEKNNMSDVIYLLGFKKNPYVYMNFADVFICSSRAEGFLSFNKSTCTHEYLIDLSLFEDAIIFAQIPSKKAIS